MSAAAAAASLQSCPTLCDPIVGSPPGSAVPGILQARTLEWVAISFSNAWKWKVKVKSLSCVRLLATPWTAAYQAPPSMGFSRQEYWSGVPLPSPMMCLGVVVLILLDLSGIYHIFLKFLPAFISPSWNSSCGVHNVLNKPFSLVSFLSVYVGCSSLRHPLNVEIPPFSFYSVYFLGLSHSLPLIASTIYMFTSPRSIYPEYTFLLSFKLWLSPAVCEIFPTWCSTGPSFLTCLKLN